MDVTSLRVQVLVVMVWIQLAVIESHVCIMDPKQRLQTGDPVLVDCYQNGTAPCGKDFPLVSLEHPTELTAGSVHTVKLFRPIVHFIPGMHRTIKISISKDGYDNFVLLGEWPDKPGENLTYDVQIPKEAGNYILQANYRPLYYDFYSCADVIVKAAEESPPPSQAENSDVISESPTAPPLPPDTTTKRFEQSQTTLPPPAVIDDKHSPPPTAPPPQEASTIQSRLPSENSQPSESENRFNDNEKEPSSFQAGDDRYNTGQAMPPSQGETSSSRQGQGGDNSVPRHQLSYWLFFLVVSVFCFHLG